MPLSLIGLYVAPANGKAAHESLLHVNSPFSVYVQNPKQLSEDSNTPHPAACFLTVLSGRYAFGSVRSVVTLPRVQDGTSNHWYSVCAAAQC